MKKTLFTLSCVAFFGLMAQAQSPQPAPAAQSKSESVNPDGTVAPKAHHTTAPNEERAHPAPKVNSAEKAQTAPDAAGQPKKDRHAITEKGVPASKSKEQKPATEKKPETTEKH